MEMASRMFFPLEKDTSASTPGMKLFATVPSCIMQKLNQSQFLERISVAGLPRVSRTFRLISVRAVCFLPKLGSENWNEISDRKTVLACGQHRLPVKFTF
jgi:hypothetical protein